MRRIFPLAVAELEPRLRQSYGVVKKSLLPREGKDMQLEVALRRNELPASAG
jgi:hypothetical protein